MRCPNCGSENNNNDKFCAECGANLNNSGLTTNDHYDEYILTYSFMDDDDKPDGKNIRVRYYNTCFELFSCKQNNGFNYSISYQDIESVSISKNFSYKSLIWGIIIIILGLWFCTAIKSDWEWYQKAFMWCIPICGAGKLIYDVNKIQINIYCKNGECLSFKTNNSNGAEMFKERISRMI